MKAGNERSEEHTSELQSRLHLVCRLLLEKNTDHYYFKLEVRLLGMLLTEERTLRDFLDSVEEIRIEILEEQPLTGAAADIGAISALIPHAFAIISLLTPIDRIKLDADAPLLIR